MHAWVLFCFIFFLLPSCAYTKKKSIQLKQHSFQKNSRIPINSIQEQEAKLVDIPIPLNVLPIARFFSHEDIHSSHTILGYHLNGMFPSDVVKFYTHEMERLGWQQIMYFDGLEQQFVFSKPDKICTVSIRRVRKKNELVITVGSSGGSFLL